MTFIQEGEMSEKKRGRGRPRLHKDTKVVSFRVPLEVADIIEGVLARIKLLSQEPHVPAPVVLIDALRARLKMLHNQSPAQVARSLNALDRAMKSYEHVQR
jgi:hypothetical protein